MTQLAPSWALTHLPFVAPVRMGTGQGQDMATLGTTCAKVLCCWEWSSIRSMSSGLFSKTHRTTSQMNGTLQHFQH